MDITDTLNAVKVSALPPEIVEKIWKPKGDRNYLKMMHRARVGNGK